MCFLRCLLSFMKHKICSFPFNLLDISFFHFWRKLLQKKKLSSKILSIYFSYGEFARYNTIYIVQLLYDIDFTIISWAQQGFQQCRQKFCNFATLLWKFPNFTSQLFLLKATSQIVNCEELVQLCYASWNVNPLSANPTKWLNTLTLTLRMVRWLAIMIW